VTPGFEIGGERFEPLDPVIAEIMPHRQLLGLGRQDGNGGREGGACNYA
jgi:hypothetical protein